MGSILVDESRWPLVVVSWPRGAITDDELLAYLQISRRQMARKLPHVVLHEAVTDTSMTSTQRRTMADYVKQFDAELRACVKGAAVVAPSLAIRGLITAVNWLSPSPFPQKVFKTRDEAEHWLQSL